MAPVLPARGDACRPAAKARAQAPPGRDTVDFEIGHARRRALAELEADAVDLAERLLLAVEHLGIEHVADEVDRHLEPMISSGIETTARIAVSTTINATTALLKRLLTWLPM